MRISVLVPCYNAEQFAASAITSVLRQVDETDEVIAIDDGSTDKTASVLARYSPRIMLLRQPNRGVASALNTGIGLASGDIIAFIDADDLWAPGKLALQLEMLSNKPRLHGVFGYMQNFTDAGQRGQPSPSSYLGSAMPGFVRGTLLVRRDFFASVGIFPENRRHGDFIEWYARAVAAGFRWVMLPELVYFRRVHDTNLGIRDRSRQRDDYLAALNEIIKRRRSAMRVSRPSSDS